MHRVLWLACTALIALPLAGSPASARSMESGDAAVAQKATQAVVNIAIWKLRQPTKAGDTPRRVKTYGSGFIIDPSGVIVTNKHVIDGALDIKVIFSNGDRISARLLGAAAMIDLAVIKVDMKDLPVLKWGDSDGLHVGDGVLAIGNPLGLGMSVSAGIVSALNRDIQDTPFDNYIQTDAAINHGNSGGPLVDGNGEVIGVDTALYNPDDAGGFIGIGLAIPADTAKFVVGHLLDPSQGKPGWLGVNLQDLTTELSEAMGVPGAKGSIIASVDADGPATKAGLRPGDVLTGIGGMKLADSRAFMRAIVQIPIGQPAELTVSRDGKEQTIPVAVAEWPNFMPGGGMMSTQVAEAMIQKMPDPGVRLAALTDASRKQYGIDSKVTGALIASVEKDCEARDLGIIAGDVVTSVQGLPIASPDDVRKAIRATHQLRRPYLAVLVQGKNGTRWVSLSMGSAGS